MSTEYFLRNGYSLVRQLADGRWIGLQRFIFTTGLCVNLSTTHGGYQYRFCYEPCYAADAVQDLLTWNGEGDPPGKWLKKKGGDGERMNPHHPEFKGIPIRSDHG